jgi:hypothetical protein
LYNLRRHFLFFVDEFGHRHYKCEFTRVQNIIAALVSTEEFSKAEKIVFFRVNPHMFRKDGRYHSKTLEATFNLLLKTITTMNFQTDLPHFVNLIYINYDSTKGKLDIFAQEDENEYANYYEKCVVRLVYEEDS